MQRREFIKISAAGAVAAAGVNLFASQANDGKSGGSNLNGAANLNAKSNLNGATGAKEVNAQNTGVDLSGAKTQGEKLAAMTPYLTLNNRVLMPILGLGTWKLSDLKQCQSTVEAAFELGYRLIDTAQAYGNEEAVGAAFAASGLRREQVFIESKIAVQNISESGVLKSFEQSMKKLKTDYADLFLLHAPMGDVMPAWRALERLYREGRIAAIGISNFYGKILAKIMDESEIKPALNQIETHPYLQHFAVQKQLQAYGVAMQAWSQFGSGSNGVLKEPALAQIGEKYGKTAAQVILRWLVQRGVSVIPKTSRKERLIENISIFDFELTDEDFARIAKLERNERLFDGWGREDI